MMITRKKQIIRYGIITVIAFCLASLVSFITLNKTATLADAATKASAEVEEIYIGDIIKANEYKVQAGGTQVPAEGMTIIYPSGAVYGGNSFEITQAGNYQITYYATVGGNKVEEVKNYLAIRRTQDVIIAEDGMTAEIGDYYVESPYALTKGITGTIVNFKAGQSITFKTRVKTAQLTKDYNILSLIAMPSVFKETDFERLTVRITDVNNPDNYVDILIDSSNPIDGAGMVSYVKAGAAGQQYGGYEGKTYHTMNYGAQVEHSFRGLGCVNGNREKITVSEQVLTISIDHATKQVFVGPASSTTKEKNMVNDLDDPAHFKSNPWGGFTSDEVTVTVTAGKFVKGEGKVVFTQIGDFDLTQTISDKIAPELYLGYDLSKGAPIAEVGKDYSIFSYVARDALDDQTKNNVWVYHVSDGGKLVSINHDGEKFFVKYPGKYKIVYEICDNSGNVTTEVVEVTAVNKVPQIVVSTDETYIEADVYEEIQVLLPSHVNVSGGSGHLFVEREITSPSGEIIDVEERLTLTEVGYYEVVYKVTDYLNTKTTYSVTICSKEVNAPKFVETPHFESKLIKGFVYELPVPHVVETINNEVVDVECSVYVNGNLANGSFVAGGEKMEIRYVAEGKSGTSEWSDEIDVVDTVGGKYRDRYFNVEGGIELQSEKNFLTMNVNGNGKAEFLNVLSARNFTVGLSFVEENVKFGAMKFILRDAKNPALTVTLSFSYDLADKNWYLQLNNGSREKFITSKDVFTFTFSSNTNKIIDAGGEAMATVTLYDNGDAFQGFTDDLIYFAIAFENISSAASIDLTKICNQSMGHNKNNKESATDDIKPIIELDGEFKVRQKLGSKVDIVTASAFDVLSQISEFTVSIYSPTFELLVSCPADQKLDYTIAKAGNYKVVYTAVDTMGNDVSMENIMIVNDETAPVLKVTNNLKSEYKLGSKIYIPKYSATDNDGVVFVQVNLIFPNNEMRMLEYNNNGVKTSYLGKEDNVYDDSFKTGDGGFIVSQKGLYVLRFVAYDEYYNYTVVEIKFNVK